MIKDLDSKWIANDRKGGWMKLKPDHAFISEIDAVVIGGHFGQGRRAGIISEYLLALAEKPSLGQTTPSSFISMCRSVPNTFMASYSLQKAMDMYDHSEHDSIMATIDFNQAYALRAAHPPKALAA